MPFRVDAGDESLIEVQLYQSSDRGKTWRFHSRRTTDQSEFPFQAEADGEYWFALKTLDRNRQLLPVGDPQTELVILVDTVQPELEFRIETDPAGRVNCRWRASDTNLDAKSLQIFYQPVESVADENQEAWLKVPVQLQGISRNGVYADQVGWWPETTAKHIENSIDDCRCGRQSGATGSFPVGAPKSLETSGYGDGANGRSARPISVNRRTRRQLLNLGPSRRQPRIRSNYTAKMVFAICRPVASLEIDQRTRQDQAVANRTTNAASRVATAKINFRLPRACRLSAVRPRSPRRRCLPDLALHRHDQQFANHHRR